MPLKIMPHGRLQEWVAEEKGFFTAEGLDYTFLLNSGDYGMHAVQRDERGEVRTGAFETFGAGPFYWLGRHIDFDEVRFRGGDCTFDHSSAIGQWGEVMVELSELHELAQAQ